VLTQELFDAAHHQWYQETQFHSFPWTILKGPGYEKIAAFGEAAIPFLLNKLRASLDETSENIQVWGIQAHLSRLTGLSMGTSQKVGGGGFLAANVDGTSRAWLVWGAGA